MDYSWIQISDLHLFNNTETTAVTDAFKTISTKEKISFIIVSGDLHQFGEDYSDTIAFLEAIRTAFGLEKKDIFIVPGNHDSGDCKRKDRLTYYIQNHVEDDPDCYYDDFTEDGLINCFSDYNQFIFDYYGSSKIYNKPEQVCVRSWNDQLNIIHLNTAIICNGDNSLNQIIDIKGLYEVESSLNFCHPTIIIAHHPFSSLHKSHQDYLKRLITNWKVSAYLCGDLHRQYSQRIDTHEGSGTTIPCIVCAKTAPETRDTYSDIGCIIYNKRGDAVEVNPYLWEKEGKAFKPSSKMDNDDGPLNFPLLRKEFKKSPITGSYAPNSGIEILSEEKEQSKVSCIWLPDAEFADGFQARFDSYTNTRIIQEYLRDDSIIFGLSAVRGVGKTFVLQIMRSKIKKDKLKLPIGIVPSAPNNWGTERIDLRTVFDYTDLRNFENVVLMWEYCIFIYVINQLVNSKFSSYEFPENSKRLIDNLTSDLNSLLTENKIDKETFKHCTNKKNDDLNKTVIDVLETQGWSQRVQHNISGLRSLDYNLNEILSSLNKEAFLVLIDKLDQSITQTSTEMPNCEGCEKANRVSTCVKPEKKQDYCKTALCNSECCYGCEKFLAIYSRKVSGLRIHEDRNKRLGHINVWQYIQQGLVVASYFLFYNSKGKIRVYYTIRQEAFAREDGLLGDDAKKIRKTVVELWYSRDEQKRIFYECIKSEKNPELLFDHNLLHKDPSSYEYAFVGTDRLCHPHVEGLSESVFDSIYRHSFDRARDIQEYGKMLSGKISSLKKCRDENERGEKVKEYIEQYAAILTFSLLDGSTLNENCYYHEKRKLLPNFWAKTENFKKLLGYFDKNLLFPYEAKRICKIFNRNMFGMKSFKCYNCHKCSKSIVHPFSMLYKMGLLGRIRISDNNENDVEQDFIHSKLVTYINGDNVMGIEEKTLYVLHPALTKSIDASVHKIGHFKGFIIGKGLKVKKQVLLQIVDEHKKDPRIFEKKYFYGGKYGAPN